MPVMPDHWIREQANKSGMIEPFVETQKRDGVISYGLSSYGYDARCADQFKIFTNVDSAVVDPKAFKQRRQEIWRRRPANRMDCHTAI